MPRSLALVVSLLFVGFVVAGVVSVSLKKYPHEKLGEQPPPIVIPSLGLTQERILGSNVYLATSAEYQATCLQIYSWSKVKLASKHDQYLKGDKKYPAAIIMDLDETVLDNTAYQTMLYNKRVEHTDALWEEYENTLADQVRLVPGAKDLIDYAEARGVVVFFISNRKASAAKAAKKSLDHLGINTENFDKRYLGMVGEKTDKTERRETVKAGHTVLMYFGDNLRDFDNQFAFPKFTKETTSAERQAEIDTRIEKVKQTRKQFGDEWIVLPNPVYGEWAKPVSGQDPKKFLP